MSEGGEVIGDIAQGALLARALEPQAGEAADGHTHEKACLNCGTALVGSHCHGCGQAAHVHKTIGAFFHDLLHGVFHFEGKIWRTLPLLAWRPGRLTREYIDGRRASYVSPIALFLFVVFLTFALFNLAVGPIHVGGTGADVGAGGGVTVGIGAQAEAAMAADVARLEARIASAKASGKPTAALEAKLKDDRAALAAVRAGRAGKLPDELVLSADPASRNLVAQANALWRKARENPDLLIYKLQSSAYKYSWMLIPLSVPFVWLLFPFSRRFGLYDHTVFVTYSLAFMLLLLAAASLASLAGVGGIVPLLMLYAPFHLYRQVRETYAVSRAGALVRAGALSVVAMTVLLLFAIALLALSLS